MEADVHIPTLIERFMENTDETERWVTVHEIRTYFGLDKTVSQAITGFLHRCYARTDRAFPYPVVRIEKSSLEEVPHPRAVNRYLIVKGLAGLKNITICKTGRADEYNRDVFTDFDAIDHFDRVLHRKRAAKKLQK